MYVLPKAEWQDNLQNHYSACDPKFLLIDAIYKQ